MRRNKPSIHPLSRLLLPLFLAALILLAAWVGNRPIAGPVGEPFTITLYAIREGAEMHRIDAGTEPSFRIWRSDASDPLLQPEMQGRTFRVLAEKRKPVKSDPYYVVIEMIAEDGSFAYTWEDHAAGQADRLPGRMLLTALLLILAIAVIYWGFTACFPR